MQNGTSIFSFDRGDFQIARSARETAVDADTVGSIVQARSVDDKDFFSHLLEPGTLLTYLNNAATRHHREEETMKRIQLIKKSFRFNCVRNSIRCVWTTENKRILWFSYQRHSRLNDLSNVDRRWEFVKGKRLPHGSATNDCNLKPHELSSSSQRWNPTSNLSAWLQLLVFFCFIKNNNLKILMSSKNETRGERAAQRTFSTVHHRSPWSQGFSALLVCCRWFFGEKSQRCSSFIVVADLTPSLSIRASPVVVNAFSMKSSPHCAQQKFNAKVLEICQRQQNISQLFQVESWVEGLVRLELCWYFVTQKR